ncbi:MAG: metallophosphoesterase [Polyangiaceae bacterium]
MHGDMAALRRVMAKLPTLTGEDTIVFVGDYIDRGPESAQVIEFVQKELPQKTSARVVALRGNHEDAWLRVTMGGWPEFVMPPANGCLATAELHQDDSLRGRHAHARRKRGAHDRRVLP